MDISSKYWKITDIKSEAIVSGITYNDVVVVEKYTKVPNITGNHVTMESVTIKYWVAKGIGMIRGYGYFNLLGEQLDVELVQTNLIQK